MSGGVHIGTAPTGPEFAAARPGTDDMTGVGAFMLPWSLTTGANDACVAMLETELLLVGLPGRGGMNELGEAGNNVEDCLGADDVTVVDAGMLDVVGVGVGVEWLEGDAALVLIAEGVW